MHQEYMRQPHSFLLFQKRMYFCSPDYRIWRFQMTSETMEQCFWTQNLQYKLYSFVRFKEDAVLEENPCSCQKSNSGHLFLSHFPSYLHKLRYFCPSTSSRKSKSMWRENWVLFREKGNWWLGKNSMNVLLSRERRVILSRSYSAYAWAGAGRHNREHTNPKQWMDRRIEFRIHLHGLSPFPLPFSEISKIPFSWRCTTTVSLLLPISLSLSLSIYIYI
jgi:hypothetical protein